mgnify:CR=1 FL=1
MDHIENPSVDPAVLQLQRRGKSALDAEVLLCAVLDKSRIQLYTNFDEPLEEQELKQYRGYVARRAAREPVAYILGHKGFLQYDFKVTQDTLIPRPETELLVEQLVSLTKDRGPLRILDLGCGSGAIVDSLLAELPEARGTGVDISPGAVEVTRENARSLGVEDRLDTVVSNLYEKVPKGTEVPRCWSSNPPYIPEGDPGRAPGGSPPGTPAGPGWGPGWPGLLPADPEGYLGVSGSPGPGGLVEGGVTKLHNVSSQLRASKVEV